MNRNTPSFLQPLLLKCITIAVILSTGAFFSSCNDDPEPVNDEEVITTVSVVLTPNGGGTPVTLLFKDADGDGSGVPVKTVSGSLAANTIYSGVITLKNESGSVPVDITNEVEEESDDHLFCFTPGANLTVVGTDADSNGLPIGLQSLWTTTTEVLTSIKIALRHQPGTKTGACPGTGETDIEIDFIVRIQ